MPWGEPASLGFAPVFQRCDARHMRQIPGIRPGGDPYLQDINQIWLAVFRKEYVLLPAKECVYSADSLFVSDTEALRNSEGDMPNSDLKALASHWASWMHHLAATSAMVKWVLR